jgi:hypothetical protein
MGEGKNELYVKAATVQATFDCTYPVNHHISGCSRSQLPPLATRTYQQAKLLPNVSLRTITTNLQAGSPRWVSSGTI